ncbi:MAG: hypothetical protein KAI97_00585 [Gemmatimonadetes bacterium]|nr:hypothetical protein [Gemmatimonadota bacterium]
MSAVVGIVAAAALFVVFALVMLQSGRDPACGTCGRRDRSGCETCGAGTAEEEWNDG